MIWFPNCKAPGVSLNCQAALNNNVHHTLVNMWKLNTWLSPSDLSWTMSSKLQSWCHTTVLLLMTFLLFLDCTAESCSVFIHWVCHISTDVVNRLFLIIWSLQRSCELIHCNDNSSSPCVVVRLPELDGWG